MLRSKKSFVVSVISLVLLASSASAQDATQPCASDVPEGSRRAMMEREGVRGLWFHPDVARCLLADVELLRLYRERTTLLGDQLQIREAQVRDLREASEAGAQAVEALTTALSGAERANVELEDSLDAWYRSPFLWTAIGLFVGAGSVIAGALLL